MRTAVCIKPVRVGLRVHLDTRHRHLLETGGSTYALTSASESAVALSVWLKGQYSAGETIAVSVSPLLEERALREGLALGADNAVRVWDPACEGSDPHVIAQILSRVLQRYQPDLVLCGERPFDQGGGQVATRLAEFLGWPSVTRVTKIEMISPCEGCVVQRNLTRNVRQIIRSSLPVVFSVEPSVFKPEYPSLENRLRARKAAITTLDLQDLGLQPDQVGRMGSKTIRLRYSLPRPIMINRPAENLSAVERLQLVSSGKLRARDKDEKRKIIEGSPKSVAQQIIKFLEEKKFLRQPAAGLTEENQSLL